MQLFNIAIGFCIVVSWFSLVYYVFGVFFSFLSSIIKKKPFDREKWSLIYLFKDRYGIFFLIVYLIGFSYPFIQDHYASTEIGSFWEMSDYTEQYEATLYAPNITPVPCIATLSKSTDIYDDKTYVWYNIDRIDLPYEKYEYVDADYDPDDTTPDVWVGYEHCEIHLGKIATEQSFKNLERTVLCPDGDYCASKKSDIFHKVTCRYVKKITPENIIYFHNPREAGLFCYSFCSECCDW